MMMNDDEDLLTTLMEECVSWRKFGCGGTFERSAVTYSFSYSSLLLVQSGDLSMRFVVSHTHAESGAELQLFSYFCD